MDENLIKYLQDHKIKYKVHDHPAVFTVEESKFLKLEIFGVIHTKNLFLKDESNKYFLVCMNAYKKLDLKELKSIVHARKKLTFASSVELKEELSLNPGSVSIFGMIYSKKVILILDKEIWLADKVGFHPNVNTSTLELDHKDLELFYNSLKSEKYILHLPTI